ncbi:MAG: nuclease-related domain-containing protein [Halomonas sp.]|uniref:nuclease-related domain-containing protein n=1 Tax=Halomonas sp. TaxID=1486246 RepID=UPI002ACD6B60|nr:nuclease-related domain-containing protein [Halomonas sp.]MDZ7852093.1 nuclease-related domain-containing protein [Halomonas sp.]
MILREKDAYAGADERGYYGHKQEQDVAFHLRRSFGDSEQIRIIHDLVIEHGGERAQIDHLVIHPYGFIIIESKSIVGEVQVNAEGEWSRSYRGNWAGIPSPIRQAELQQDLLKALLRDNVEQLLGKLLGIQTQVGHREWRTLCAISSTAILHRDKMPKGVANKVMKTEFVAKKVREVVGNIFTEYLKGKPRFTLQEMENLGNFLLVHTAPLQAGSETVAQEKKAKQTPYAAPVSEPAPLSYAATPELDTANPSADNAAPASSLLTCKQCGEADHLTGMYGQYGYYVKCGSCKTNTSMKQTCPACGWKSVKISKDGPSYTANCQKCDHQYLVYREGEERA